MADLMLTCDVCRHRMRVSEFQLGMEVVCPNCKADVTVAEANTTPLEPKEPAPEYEPFAAKTKDEPGAKEHGVERCGRCKAVIKGDWDRYETEAGVWCHRCVNRVRGPGEEEVRVLRRGSAEAAVAATAATARPEPENVVPEGVNDTPLTREDVIRQHEEAIRAKQKADQPRDDKPEFMRKYPEATRAALWTMVAIVFLATFYYFFLAPDTGTRVIEHEEAVQAISEVPTSVGIGLSMGFWFLATVAPLYLTLYLANKLPTNAVIPDAIHVTALSVILALVSMITIVPIFGTFLYLFIAILLLWSVYEMNLSDFITWILLTFLLRYLILMPLESRILYSIAQVSG